MKLSVITVCLNAEKTILRTIQSVIDAKRSVNFEYIIVDGFSKDLTLQIIQENKQHIDFVVSEPDKGIYDAMNKGVRIANGEYIYFLNADDTLADGFNCAVSKLRIKPVYFSTVLFWNKNGFPDHLVLPEIENNRFRLQKASTMLAPHQGMFSRKEINLKHPFRTDLKVCSDYDFLLNIIENKYEFEHVNAVVANFYDGGISSVKHSCEYVEVLLSHKKLFTSMLTQWEKKIVYRHVLKQKLDKTNPKIKEFIILLSIPLTIRFKEQLLNEIDKVLKR